MKKRIAVISAILEYPDQVQSDFNRIISDYKDLIKGRMGIPFQDYGISVISITILGTLDQINGMTGKIGNIRGVTVKTSISKKEIE